ncbi:putative phytosulfokines 6 isoform X2 [Hibiscus syriacus]|uniref:putative phytosulfokines 6 isoform X2 n=1 Tax=Hibiscus syriacus TaxID=106335 RepID=UPI0019248B18|nr:putative phytosulfokines 6 isoform X2 [Hibiscus syriacus]
MKRRFLFTVFLLFSFTVLISSSHISARFSGNKQREEEVELSQITDMEGTELMNLMGMEACDEGDDGCLKRRIIAEAHLDYIYTQHHQP